MADENDEGFLSSSFSSPYVSIPYAILSGLAAGASPGTARVGQGLNAGLGMGIAGEKYAGEQKRKQRLSEALGKFSSTTVPTSVTKTGMDPETTTFSMPAPSRALPNAGGNISNLYNRKTLNNPDGSVSTTRSMSFNDNGREVLIPTVVEGKGMTPEEAIQHYYQTGEQLGKFDSPASADKYANDLHLNQEEAIGLRDARLNSLAPAQPLPKYTATEQRPIMTPVLQQYFDAVRKVNPDAAATMMGNILTKEQAAPHVFGSAESGYHALDRSGAVTPLVPGVPRAVRESTPPRPVFSTQGGNAVSSVFNPTTKQWETTTEPATAAPARALTPEDKDLKKAQTAHALAQTRQATAQANRISEATKLAKDPKTTTEKLTTELSVALRGQKAATDNYDEAAMASWGLLVNELQSSLAQRAKERNAGNAPTQTAQGSDPKDPLGIRKKK